MRRGGAWLYLLIVVPIASGVAAALLVGSQPLVFSTTGLVQVDAPYSSTTGQATATFITALTSAPVIKEAADLAGVPVDSVAGKVKGRSTASAPPTGLVEVTYRGPDEDKAQDIVVSSSTSAAAVLYAAPLAAAQAAVLEAQAQYDAAVEAAAAVGLTQLLEQEKAAEQRINVLSNSANPASVTERLDSARAELNDVRTKLATFASQRRALEDSEATLRVAEKNLARTQAQATAAANPDTVTLSPVVPVSRRVDVVRAAVAGALIGFGLATLVVAAVVVKRTRPVQAVATDARPVAAESVSSERLS